MSTKRFREREVNSSATKKFKMECYFPLGIIAIILEVGKYFGGDYLLNYKLVCKEINVAMKDKKPEPMEITIENYQRTTSTPGFHFIKVDENAIKLLKVLKFSKYVTRLLLDYGGIKMNCRTRRPVEFLKFFNLHSLKIIRYVDTFFLNIEPEYKTLSTLEIYTTDYIVLYLKRKVENVRLYSTRIRGENSFSVIAIYVPEDLAEYGKEIPFTADSREVINLDRRIMSMSGARADVVPNHKFL